MKKGTINYLRQALTNIERADKSFCTQIEFLWKFFKSFSFQLKFLTWRGGSEEKEGEETRTEKFHKQTFVRIGNVFDASSAFAYRLDNHYQNARQRQRGDGK